MISPRREMIAALRGFWEELRGGRYFVKRGVIAWPSFDFEAHPFAVALMLDSITPFRQEGVGIPCRLAFEIGAKIPAPEDPPNIDDGLMDELIDDVERTMYQLMRARCQGDPAHPVTFSLKTESAVVTEWHDTDLRIQGLTFTIDLTY